MTYFREVINNLADMLNSAARVNASNGRDSNGCGDKAKLISPAALAKNTIDRASVSRFFMVFKINWLKLI